MVIKRIAILGLFIAGCVLSVQPTSVKAASTPFIIVHRISGCDYFMVETRTDYAILEWFGEHDPDKEDMLIGNLSSYGMKDFHDETADETVHAYVEEYGLSKVDALEKLIDKCE